MIIVMLTFDTQALSRDQFDKATQQGLLVAVSGLLNLKWEEFSALEAARDLNLHNVNWETTRDDTPGSLDCLVHYENLTLADLQKQLHAASVLEYAVL